MAGETTPAWWNKGDDRRRVMLHDECDLADEIRGYPMHMCGV